MDEELEQRGVTPKSFFDQVTETRETAQTAQKTSNSNLTLLKELKEKVEIISNDLKFLKDEAKDRAFEEEDRKQKEEMEAKVKEQNEKAQGATLGDKGGVKEPEQKGLMGQVGSFLSNFIGGIVGGAIGFTLSGIGGLIGGTINLGKKALDLGKSLKDKLFGKKKDKKGGKVKTDKLLGVVEEEDDEKKKENDKNLIKGELKEELKLELGIGEKLKEVGGKIKETGGNILGGIKKTLGGIKDTISNFDGRPGSRKTKDTKEKDTKEIKEQEVKEEKPKFYADYIKEGATIEDMGPGNFLITYPDGRENFITTIGKGGRGNTVEEKFNDYVTVDAAQKVEEKKREEEREKERLEFGKRMYESFPDKYNPDGTRKENKNEKNKKKKNIFGFNFGGLVQGYNQGGEVDSVPAMLTPGEFVVTKDAVEKVGADTLKGLNASVGATNKASNLGSFEIKRLDPNDLSKDALVKKSSFAKGIKDIEISNESGSDYFRTTTDMSTGGLSETTVKKTRFTETAEDGTVTVFDKKTTMTEKIASIGVPDLIEHQDQLLGEIHKLKGFENVTIDQVINQTTGIPQEKLLPILMRSDAQKATDEKEDKAMEEDRKARGIKPGQGFSMSVNDEVAKSLAGTIGYRIGQINPDMLVSSMTDLKEETKVVTKTGVEPKTNSSLTDLSASINASVKGYNEGGLVGSSITPIIESKNESGEMELIQNLSQSVGSNSQNINVIQAQTQAMNPPNNNPQTTVPAEPSNTTLTGLQDTDAPIPFAMLLKQNAQRYLNLGNNAMVIS